jgi:maltose alpha-D-glucosyltransferase / alpha-amylase
MLDNDPLWYKDAIIYQLHIRAFHDSVGDGVGDFRGLTQKLDYLQDLGVTVVWLLPFYPSPLKDDGYDIADYTSINPTYGRLDDFKEFLDAAHARGLRVITELVVNHTSDQHPWFRRARLAPPGSPERDFYVWSDTPDRYKEARIIFKDFERSNWAWDPVANAYYWHRFYAHQPDLNFDNPAVWEALFPVMDFWMGLGVDGMRLDAIPYLYEREGTNCENLPETHAYLKALRAHVDAKWPNRMLLAEANQWPEDAVAYFGDGDECHAAFHFPVMPRMFMALHQEDRFPILDILAQTPAIPDTCQWCMFLRNHDELTLEMVTDEERDYMYRAYARDPEARINLGIRRRLAPLLNSDRRRIELMNALLFCLPGTPVIYYGDEIGMGDNIYLGDRNGVRTPMQWSSDRNGGFSRANPQKLFLPVIIDPAYHYEAVNVEAQQNNPSSLLWWMKRLIALRKQYRAFGRGSLTFLKPTNPKILAFVRQYDGERILVVANLSRFVQHVELDLSEFRGLTPEELFGRSQFPAVGDRPYPLSLGPHTFFWFSLTAGRRERLTRPAEDGTAELPVLRVTRDWGELLTAAGLDRLEPLLPEYIRRRQPSGRPRVLKAAFVEADFPLKYADTKAHFLRVRAEPEAGLAEAALAPLTFVRDDQAAGLLAPAAAAGLARVEGPHPGILVDAVADPAFCRAILEAVVANKRLRVADGELIATALPRLVEFIGPDANLTPTLAPGIRGNSSVVFGDRLILKLFFRIEDGINPDLEVGRFLTERYFAGAPAVVGAIEYRRRRGEPITLGVVHQYVPHEENAWQYTLDQLSSYFERLLTAARDRLSSAPGDGPEADELIGQYLPMARLLGRRTAELHAALAAGAEDPAFAPEPFGKMYQRSLYQSLRNLIGHVVGEMTARLDTLPEETQPAARALLDRQDDLLRRFRGILDRALGGARVRCHGDYHLGQLLFTGNNFVVTDFEGDAARSISERRLKRSPLRDVASMVRSFDYAAHTALYGLATRRGHTPGLVRDEDQAALAPWAAWWYRRVAREFVSAYLSEPGVAGLLPADEPSRRLLLDFLTLEKALQEFANELIFRPEGARIPLAGVLALLGSDSTG